ncbi:ABC transporter [Nesterenkonia aurantiaca]|uniref:Carbohydrate ABC transporter membrane protein 1 (CUT1 family) n=1 Tax=Nesterenkonia aurantiaca TaxID=1436010 RepID=A0A4V3EBZ0_9MICC|nr:ABC transporter [Nesterenkonia aurantiaca]TDS84282.1 carbohydrate ABC transporter membrane protein 1 (CUT1 family) [Nesterenkonia aurantiaca]
MSVPSGQRSASRRALLTAAPAVLLVVLVIGAALLTALLQSLGFLPVFGEARFSTEAWADGASLLESAGVSLYLATASTALALVVGFLVAAYALTAGRGGRLVAALSAATIPIPHLVASGAIGLLLADAGFLARVLGMPEGFPQLVGDSWWAAVILEFAWKESAFVALVVLGGIGRPVAELTETAATLGASARQRMLHVILPLARVPLGVAGLVVFVYTLGSYEAPWLLGPVAPEPLSVRAVRLFGSVDLSSRPEAMATALTSVAVALAVIGLGLLLTRRSRRRSRAQSGVSS